MLGTFGQLVTNTLDKALKEPTELLYHVFHHYGIQHTRTVLLKSLRAQDTRLSVVSKLLYVLRERGVSTTPIKLRKNFNTKDTSKLPLPFLINTLTNTHLVCLKIDEQFATVINSTGQQETIELTTLNEMMSPIAVLMDLSKAIPEYGYPANYAAETRLSFFKPVLWALICCLCLSHFLWAFFQVPPDTRVIWGVLCVSSALGLLLSLILVNTLDGVASNRARSFCERGENISCSDVLRSQGSRVFNIPFADIGVVYFAGILLILIQAQSVPSTLQALVYLSGAYALYSITYQGIFLRKWCLLCVFVQAIFCIQIVAQAWSLGFINEVTNLDEIQTLAIGITIFLLTGTFWAMYRSSIVLGGIHEARQIELHRFLSNPKNLAALTQKQSALGTYPLRGDLALGTPYREAPSRLYIVLSYDCVHCANAFLETLHLLENTDHTYQIYIRIHDGNKKSEIGPIISSLIEAGHLTEASRLLKRWYLSLVTGKPFRLPQSLSEFPLDQFSHQSLVNIKEITEWLNAKSINRTPTFIAQDKLFPEIYRGNEMRVIRQLIISSAHARCPENRAAS